MQAAPLALAPAAPRVLVAKDFAAYPPRARTLAVQYLDLLNVLSLPFAAILLREVISYDWRFPAERADLDRQLSMLQGLPRADLIVRTSGFAAISLSTELQQQDYAASPGVFMDSFTAWLWSSGQMESFRQAAEAYANFLSSANPMPRPHMRRLTIVVVGQGVSALSAQSQSQLFSKLRPHGTHFTRVDPANGLAILLDAASKRAAVQSPANDYLHWYIDGGPGQPAPGLTQISYAALQQPLEILLKRIQSEIDSGSMGPERLRSTIAQLKPEEIGLRNNPVLDRFSLSLLTEGSGTQIFSTTFVQWAARECIRRAQPETLVLRFAPRREVAPMNVMLSSANSPTLDPMGSLTDADMGAFYTWINLNRLSGADEMSFVAWFEDHGQALVIGPGLPRGTSSDSHMTMHQVLALVT